MKKLIITMAVSMSVALTGVSAALAQNADVTIDANGQPVASQAGTVPSASGEGTTIVYGDINTGGASGAGHTTVITPPTVIQSSAPPPVSPAPAPVEAAPAATSDTTAAAAPAETGAVATADDLDADNYPDAQEPDLGLDPNNPDTDGDGVADGDELQIYGTDPTVWDTDGDGVSDGEELFGIHTDPLVWDDFSADDTADAAEQQVAAPMAAPAPLPPVTETKLAQGTTEHLTATDGNAAALGTGNASAAPGTVTRPGATILGPDGTYSTSETAPPVITMGDNAPAAPASVTAPVEDVAAAPVDDAAPVDAALADTTAASPDDLDADNEPDALEPDLGLDPGNPDTDGDGVADGDELSIYGTDPTVYDTDGDGLADGEELFSYQTDPLNWDTDGDDTGDGPEVLTDGTDPLTAPSA